MKNESKNFKDFKFVWVDLEMTGLDPTKDVILEVATIITDSQLNIIATGPDLVSCQPPDVLGRMSNIVAKMHKDSGLIDKVKSSCVPLLEIEKQTVAFIKSHCQVDKAVLAGNSIWQDRRFIERYMPQILDYLHYRIIDVSSIRILIQAWYPDNPNAQFQKKDTHRALEDIKESIEQLKHYKNYFFKK